MFIGGNWKCNNTLKQTRDLIANTINILTYKSNKIEVLIAPTTLHIPETVKKVNSNILISL